VATKILTRRELAEAIGARVLKAREQAGLSQQELSKRCRTVSRETIRNTEHGRNVPSIMVLDELARVLRVRWTDFLPPEVLVDYSVVRATLDKLRRKTQAA
jgi:transcriptional regulator with XRE-family HTH domain